MGGFGHGCRWCSNTAVSESKSMSPSKAHHEIHILMKLLQKALVLPEKINLACSDPRLTSPGHLATRSTPFGLEGPGWFSAITCNTWLRLDYRSLFSAWFFSTQLWYFRFWNLFLAPWIPDLDPGGLQLRWGRFWAEKGTQIT